MAGFARDLGRALTAETLKTRRTLALRLAFIAPLLVVFLEFLIFRRVGQRAAPKGDIWTSLMQNSLMLWDLLMVPLFVTLETALLAGLEHANKNWKHLFALPISRSAIYAAKQILALGMIGLSTIVLWVLVILAGFLLKVLRPGIGFEAALPVWKMLGYAMISYAASWLIIAIHTWVGMRWPSFVFAMSVGVAATVATVIVIQSDYNVYYPWTLPAIVARTAETHLNYIALSAGALGGVVFAILGCLEFTRRDVV